MSRATSTSVVTSVPAAVLVTFAAVVVVALVPMALRLHARLKNKEPGCDFVGLVPPTVGLVPFDFGRRATSNLDDAGPDGGVGPEVYAVTSADPQDAGRSVIEATSLCFRAAEFVHPSVPSAEALQDDGDGGAEGWPTESGLSHLLLSSKLTPASSSTDVVVVFCRRRRRARYYWVPGWSRVEGVGGLPLGGFGSALENDVVGLTMRKPDGKMFLSIAGSDSGQPAGTTEFVACNETRRRLFTAGYPNDVASGPEGDLIRHKVRKMLFGAKLALDALGIPFWLSSGTCLGYFRQCDVMPYADDVDIGVFAEDFNERIVSAMEGAGFQLEHRFGLVSDSYQLAFMSTWLKLDVFFFYKERDHFWNGGTQASTGLKFKYLFPPFRLCWTEFLGLLVRVPCHDTEAYVEANYGENWFVPVRRWDWKSSASNVVGNGRWDLAVDDAVEFFHGG